MALAFRTLAVVLMVTVLKAEATLNIGDAIRADIEITINQNGVDETLSKVPGAEQCDGSSTFQELRYACASPTRICEVHGDNVARTAQLTFKAGERLSQLGAQIKVGVRGYGEKTLVDKVIDGSGVKSGETYQVNAKISAQPHSVGYTVTVTIELYDANNPGSLQLCAKADFKIIE